MPHVIPPKGFILKPNEAIRLSQTVEGVEFRVTRPLTPGYRRHFACPESARDAVIAALIQVGPWQPGKKFFAKEPFKVRFDAGQHQSWVTWVADGGIANGTSLHGRTQFVDGTFSATIMPRWASRCLLTIVKVEVVYEGFEPSRNGLAAHTRVGMKVDWCWAITFVRESR